MNVEMSDRHSENVMAFQHKGVCIAKGHIGLMIAQPRLKSRRRLFMEKRKEGETAKMKRLISESGQIEPKHVAFNQAVTMPYHTDNGTKYNVVPRRIVEAIQQVCCNVKTQRLSTPIEGKAIGGAIIICNESIRLDL
ncbi:hypothetical protein F443_01425 [Phytophthora nicotianae P1569]|uniref:Uncharacterized protein n=1 Tax=Phytophthora nicotianae P1569 TaxID=1317065 RepID=V9FWS3_PHYNI|nr:hypothetical protein F443_01425 [Phytophthora nicotianae P1569]